MLAPSRAQGRLSVTRAVLLGALALLALVAVAAYASAETTVPAGLYTTSQTWTVAGSPYNLTGAVQFRNNALLTIEPGVVVRGASSGAYLQIGMTNGYCCNGLGDAARISALGTLEAPIVFEAGNASQGWGGLRFRANSGSGTGTLANVTIAGANGYAADLQSTSAVTFDNVTFQAPAVAGLSLSSASPTVRSSSFVGGQRGIVASADSRPVVTDTSFSDQSVRHARVGVGTELRDIALGGTGAAIELVTGASHYTSSARIYAIDGAYELVEPLTVRNGATLTIDAGTHLRAVPSAYIQIGTNQGYCCNGLGDAGTLTARGTASAPIVLEAATPAQGWGGLRFRAYSGAGSGTLENVTLAGASGYAADVQSTSLVTFDNVTFQSPATAGLYVSSASPTVRFSTFVGGERGVLAGSWDSRPVVTDSTFRDQTVRHARFALDTTLARLTFEGTGGAVELTTQNTTYLASARIHRIDVPYELLDGVTLRSAATLTIDAGTTLRMMPWVAIQIGTNQGYCCNGIGDNGVLAARGTQDAPIVLEAANASAGWPGLRFRSYYGNTASGTLANATIRHAQAYAADVQNTNPVTFDNVTFQSPAVAGLYLAGAAPTVRTSLLAGGQYGILASGYDSRPNVIDTHFAAQSTRHARVGIGTPIANASFSGTGSSIELLTGNQIFTSSVTLGPVGVPYDLVEWVAFRQNSTLTLQPGLHLRLAPGKYLQIGTDNGYCCNGVGDNGHLVAEGTQAAPIAIESTSGSNATGWAGLRFRSYYGNTATGILRNVTLADVNGNAVDASNVNNVRLDNASILRTTAHGVAVSGGATVTIVGGTIDSTGGYGAFASDTSSGAIITGTSFTGQAGRPWRLRMTDVITEPVLTGHLQHEVEYYGVDVTSDRVLRTYRDAVTNETYASVILTSFTIRNTATWTVLPGARVLVENNQQIAVGSCCSNPSSRGNLSAEGTEALPIVFSSRSGSTTNAWNGFYLRGDYGGGAATLRNATISFSRDDGIEASSYSGLTLDNVTLTGNARYGAYLASSSATLRSCTIGPNGAAGLYLSDSSPSIRGCAFVGGPRGIDASSYASAPSIVDSSFTDQTTRWARLGLASGLSNNTFGGNGTAVELWAGNTYYSSHVRLPADAPRYELSQWAAFYYGGSLTLEPGVAVRAAPDAYVEIGRPYYCNANDAARLSANGTLEAPIVIDAQNATQGWGGLRLRSCGGVADGWLRNVTLTRATGNALLLEGTSAATIDNVTVDRAGANGIHLSSASPAISQCAIVTPGAAGIYLSSSSPSIRGCTFTGGARGVDASSYASVPTIVGSRFTDQTTRWARLGITSSISSTLFEGSGTAVELWGGNTYHSANARLSADPAEYELAQWAGFLSGAALTLEPGVHLRAAPDAYVEIGRQYYCNANDAGRLSANGTVEAPIVIEPTNATQGWGGLRFRTCGGLADGWLRNVTLTRVAGNGITIESASAVQLDNVTLDRPGANGIHLSSASPTITSCRVLTPGAAGVYLSSASPTLRGCTFTGGARGVDASSYGSAPTILGSRFTDQSVRWARVGITSSISSTLFEGTGTAVELWGGNTYHSVNARLSADPAEYELSQWAGFLYGATLTIEPGVHLRSASDAYFEIGRQYYCNASDNGRINASGTSDDPILLEPLNATQGWGGIRVRSCGGLADGALRNATLARATGNALLLEGTSALAIDNVTIDRPGANGISLSSASPTIVNCSVVSPAAAGIYLASSSPTVRACAFEGGARGVDATSYASTPTIVGSRFTDQSVRWARVGITSSISSTLFEGTGSAVELWGGNTLHSTSVRLPAYPGEYELTQWAGFISGSTLTLDPGVRVRLAPGAYFEIGRQYYCNSSDNGRLVANGTPEAPVRLEALNNASGWGGLRLRACGGLTDGWLRNATLAGIAGHGIEAQSTSAVVLDNVTIERASGSGLYLNGATLTLRNVVTRSSGGYGAQIASAAITWRGGGVSGSGSSGIHMSGCGGSTFSDLTVENANGYGIYADSSCNGAHMDDIAIANTTGRPYRNRLDADVRNVTATAPGIREVELLPSTISGARTLRLEPVLDTADGTALPSVVLGTFTVNGGAVLELAPGMELRFRASEYVQFGSSGSSRGTLVARGTRERPIGIAAHATSWGSATNGGLSLEWTGTNVLENVTIDRGQAVRAMNDARLVIGNATIERSGGSGVHVGAGVWAFINDTRIANSTGRGIYLDGAMEMARANVSQNGMNGVDLITASATIRASTFYGNAHSGLNVTSGNPTLDVRQSYFTRNARYGVDLGATTGSTIVDNAFIENAQGQARATAWNRWNLTPTLGRNIAYGPTLGGNSWSDYAGEDTDGNGLGDTLVPYNAGIAPGGDLHPVMGNLYADFTVVVPDVVGAPLELLFRDASRGGFSPADQWVWDMGDGGQYVTENVTHAFAADGSYPVQLLVANPHGQVSSITRTVHVDSIAPVTTAVLNGTLGLKDWHTSAVVVALNATDDRSGVDRTLFRLNGGNLTTYLAPFAVTANGGHNVTFHSVDRNGNVEPAQTLAFRIDRTLPVMENATVNGTLGNGGWYVADVAVGLRATDNVSGVDRVEYAFNATPSQLYEDGVVLAQDGIAQLRYRPVDNAGLVGLERNLTLRRDATPPAVQAALSGPLGGGGWWLGTVSVNASAADATSGLAALNASVDGAWAPVNGTFHVAGHGNHTVAFLATDAAGNANSTLALDVRIDTVAPVSEHHFEGTPGLNGVYVSGVNVTFSGNDSGSGVASYVYSLDDGPNLTYDGPFALLVDGQHRLVYRAIDLAGNAETVHEVIVVLELEAPTTALALNGTAGAGGWFLSNVSAELSVDDPASLDRTLYAIDGGDALTYLEPFLVSGAGVHNVTFHSVSVGGLVEEPRSRLVRIDLAPPAVGIAANGTLGLDGWHVSPVSVVLTPADDASGIQTTRVAIDGANLATYTTPPVVAATGAHNASAETLDVAGRLSPLATLDFRLDLDDPVATLAALPAQPDGAGGWYVSSPLVWINATDVGAGVSHVLASVDGGELAPLAGPLVLGEGVHTVAYQAVDLAGRVEPLRNATIRVDLTAPVLDHALAGAPGLAGWYVGPVNATLAPTDATSGIAAILASIDGAPEAAVSGPLVLSTTRDHTVAWRAVDAAGLSTNATFRVPIDRSAPTLAPSVAPPANAHGWRKQDATAFLNASDQGALGSGVAALQLALDGGAFGAYGGPTSIGEGFHNVTFRGIDVAGLVNTSAPLAVNVDLTPPVLSHAMRAPDTAEGWHLANVPVNITATDALSGVRVIEWWIDQGSVTTTTSRTITLDREGEHVLHVRARDFADVLSATLDVPYKLDVSAPQVTHALSGTAGGASGGVQWYRTPVNMTLLPTDAGAGIVSTTYRVDGGDPQAYTAPVRFATEGARNVTASATDGVGRLSATLTLPTFGVDTTAPVTNWTLDGALDPVDGIYKTNVTVTLASLDALSGVAAGKLEIDNGTGWRAYTAPLLYSTSGTHTLDVRASDVAGNVEAVKRLVFEVFVDTTPPVSSFTPLPNGWSGRPVNVTLTASDAQSSVLALLYRVGDGEIAQVAGNTTVIALATEGVHTIEYAALDVAGNAELFRNATWSIDLTPPTLDVTPNVTMGENGWIVAPVTLTPSAADALSGIASVKATVNGVERTIEGALTLDRSGFYNVTLVAYDLGGLASEPVAWSGRLDLDAPRPTVHVVGPQGIDGWHKGNVSVLLAASDALAGLDAIEYSWDDGAWAEYPGSAFQFADEGVHVLRVRALDLAGNVGAAPATTVGIDRTRPLVETQLEGTRGLAGWWVSPVTATTLADDVAPEGVVPSGVHNLTQRVDDGPNETVASPALATLASGGTHTIRAYALDLALNGAGLVTTVPIDLDDPTLAHTLEGEEGLHGWFLGPVTLEATSLDGTSGPLPPTLDGAPLLAPALFDEEGVHELALVPLDVAGRAGAPLALSIPIDLTPPAALAQVAGEPAEGGWYTEPTAVTLSMLDALSGPGLIEYSLDGADAQPYGAPIVLDESGIHVLEWTAFDVAGNPTQEELVIKLDLDVPVANATLAGTQGLGGWFRSGVTIALNATDPTSGIARIEYRIDDGAWLPFEENITLDTEGVHRIEYVAIDESGTPSIVYFHEILIDLTTPVVDLQLRNTLYAEFDGHLYLDASICVELTGIDALSGVSSAVFRVTGAFYSVIDLDLDVSLQCFEVEGEGPIEMGIGVCDNALHCEEMDLGGFVDKSGPGAQIVRPFPGALNLQNVTLPIFSTAFANPDAFLQVQGEGLEEGTPLEDFDTGTRQPVLAQTTMVAGPRVPVWVSAYDAGNPIGRVELFIDGVLVGAQKRTENVTYSRIAWERDEESLDPPRFVQEDHTMEVYVFEIDTLALPAGEHELSATAWDLPGRAGKTLRLFSFLSPAAGNETANVLEAALADPEYPEEVPDDARPLLPEPPTMPAELRAHSDELVRIARIFLRLYDTLFIDNHVFLDENLVDFLQVYETAESATAPVPSVHLVQLGGRPAEVHDGQPVVREIPADMVPAPEGGSS